MSAQPPESNPSVFISYAHEGDLVERVRSLAEWLGQNGVQVHTDHQHSDRPPPVGWRAWMQHQIEEVDVVVE